MGTRTHPSSWLGLVGLATFVALISSRSVLAGSGNWDEAGTLELSVEMHKELSLKTHRPWVRILILNRSTKATYWINKRMAWKTGAGGQIELNIKKVKDGEPVTMSCRIRSPEIIKFDYMVLFPGEVVGGVMELDECFNIAPGIEYELVVSYQDAHTLRDPLPATLPGFTGPTTSRPGFAHGAFVLAMEPFLMASPSN